MAANGVEAMPTTARSGPEVVAPTNRINVALPFARIEVAESSKEVAELASIVIDLIAVVEASSPNGKVKELRERAQALSARLR